MKLTKTKLKQIIRETIKEGGAMGHYEGEESPGLSRLKAAHGRAQGGPRLEELKETKEVLLDNMKAARYAEQYDIASSLEKSVMALEEAISALFYK